MIEILIDWVKAVITALGYPGLALVMFLENVFPPIPSEIILPLAGSLTVNGPFNLIGVILAGTVGSTAGAWLFYSLGRWYDEQRLRALVRNYGKWFALSEDDLGRTFDWFRRYGEWTVFFARMVPIVRSLISIPAGMAHMNGLRFTLYSALGTAAWNLALAVAGRMLGHGWPLVSSFIDRFQNFTAVMITVLLVAFFASRLVQRWSEKQTDKSR